MASTIDIKLSNAGKYQVLNVTGKIDSETSDKLTKKLTEVISSGQVNIILEFSKVTFMSSAGIGATVKALNDCKMKKGNLKIAGIQQEVKNVYDLLGFSGAFQFFATVADAAK